MKLNLGQTFLNLEDKLFEEEPGKPLTLRRALLMSVTAELPGDSQGSGPDILVTRMTNFDIYLAIRESKDDEFEVTAEDVVHLKKRVPLVLHTLICGPVINLLDGKEPYARTKK
jgi:hypothetical protein